jgi:hypothetical protein
MAYKSAEELMKNGLNGKWYKPGSDFEKEVIIHSIAGDNLIRGAQGRRALRHYEQDGYVVVTDEENVEPHPNDKR